MSINVCHGELIVGKIGLNVGKEWEQMFGWLRTKVQRKFAAGQTRSDKLINLPSGQSLLASLPLVKFRFRDSGTPLNKTHIIVHIRPFCNNQSGHSHHNHRLKSLHHHQICPPGRDGMSGGNALSFQLFFFPFLAPLHRSMVVSPGPGHVLYDHCCSLLMNLSVSQVLGLQVLILSLLAFVSFYQLAQNPGCQARWILQITFWRIVLKLFLSSAKHSLRWC